VYRYTCADRPKDVAGSEKFRNGGAKMNLFGMTSIRVALPVTFAVERLLAIRNPPSQDLPSKLWVIRFQMDGENRVGEVQKIPSNLSPLGKVLC